MRETVLSNNEKNFVEKAILERLRVDKRQLNEFRNLNINYGLEWGSCCVSLGETRVFAQVSCEVAQPKATRPNEGTIFINVEMGPMAAPHFEIGFPLSDSCIQINRILERTLRESKCIDLESLCIISEEKVWNLRVDVAVLNHEGNIMDCACVAAVAALAHFKRPDVTTSGNNEFVIHTAAEKDLIPTVLHHYPICVSYALFNEGKVAVVDPTALEERVSDANLILAINSYNELCCMHLGGVSLTSPHLILRCSEKAAERAKRIVAFIKDSLEADQKRRADGDHQGFAESIRLNKILSNVLKSETIEDDMDQDDSYDELADAGDIEIINNELEVVNLDSKTVTTKQDLNKWNNPDESDNTSESDDDMEEAETATASAKPKPKAKAKAVPKPLFVGDSSEEEETIVLK